MVDLTRKVIEGAIALFVVAAIATIALQSLFSAAMPSVPSAVSTLLTTLVGILFAVGIALAFYRTYAHDG